MTRLVIICEARVALIYFIVGIIIFLKKNTSLLLDQKKIYFEKNFKFWIFSQPSSEIVTISVTISEPCAQNLHFMRVLAPNKRLSDHLWNPINTPM